MARLLLLCMTFVGLLASAPVSGQPADPDPAQLRALADLLRDPAVQAWLEASAQTVPDPAPPIAAGGASLHDAVAARLDAMTTFLHTLGAAIPSLPAEIAQLRTSIAADLEQRSGFGVMLLLGVFAALGFGLEWLFWRGTTGFRQRMIATSLETTTDRLRAVATRALYGLGVLLAFAAGSIGAFLLFDWPPLLRQIVLAYLLIFLVIRLVLVLGRILLAPAAERFRVIPMATVSARFWFVWSAVLVGWFFFVKISVDLLADLGMGAGAVYLIGVTGGVVLLALALIVVWRHPTRDGRGRASQESRLQAILLSLYLIGVWLLLFTGSATPFFVGVILLLLPIAIRATHLGVNHLLRPADGAPADPDVRSMTAVMLERGLRAALLVAGAYAIAWVVGFDLVALTTRDTLATRLLRGAINAAIIVLLADLAWHLLAAWIDGKLAAAQGAREAGTEEARRQARLRTLLPILRNVLLIVLLTMAALMALSALGVEIGPLIAGAGVIGVALGFGAQTLVKDIISGMFYLLDDAFRVGEYIQSGNYKGTVEAFSLRSIKLRHHRGPLYTVPFGELGAIENMSRDWVIDKMTVSVTYDTDLDRAKKIIKQVGRDLGQDPELAPHIIETLKMQGVEQFGDFAIQLRLKMMTKPGEQFVIRRRAYALIKKAFAAGGIEFAFPTVQVAGGGATAPAAAQALEMNRPPAAAE